MSFEERAIRALEMLARRLGDKAADPVEPTVREVVVEKAQRVGVGLLDRLVSRLAGRPVRTLPRLRQLLPFRATQAKTTVTAPRAPSAANASSAAKATTAAKTTKTAASSAAAAPSTQRTAGEAPSTPPPAAPSSAAPSSVRPSIAEPSSANTSIAAPSTAEPLRDDAPREREGATDSTRPIPPPRRSEPPSIPSRFGIDRIVLLIREPNLGFAYWEIDSRRIHQSSEGAGRVAAELRLIDLADHHVVTKSEVSAEQGRCYLPVLEPGHRYAAELVLVRDDGGEVVLSRSRPVETRSDRKTESRAGPPSN